MAKRCMGCMETYDEEYDICPHCGFVEGTLAEEAIHMDPGTLLYDRYIVGKVIGYGGFGVTYLAWDGRLEQKVAIKEYLPNEFSTRMPGQSVVTVFNGDKHEQFDDGLSKFVDEAKRLAKFQNEPGVVKIFDSFTENGTAYIVMEYLEGETLTERLKREKRIPEEEAVKMIIPVLESLKIVHEAGIIHRDIAPDNIFLTKDGQVKLIDFGASRFATTSHSRSLTVIIKPGYSPEEQYRSRGDQGPHTDVYALGAVLYKMITGVTPPDALERRVKIETQKKDIFIEPVKQIKGVSEVVNNAVCNAMNIRIEDRTENVGKFMEELRADTPVQKRQGKIKKIDLYRWPVWLKIAVPAVVALILAFGVLLATNVISFQSLFSGDVNVPKGMVSVPDLEGMEKDEAFALLESMDIVPSTSGNIDSDYVGAGKIVLQSPVSGKYVNKYGAVMLFVSSGGGVAGPVDGVSTVPYIVWDTEEDALAKLKTAGLGEPTILTEYDNNVAAGKIISQKPEYGEKVPEGTSITITISLGPKTFTVPSVVGMTESEARSVLEGLGMTVTVITERSGSVASGNVISQSITPGTTAKSGDAITITASTGNSENTTETSQEQTTASRQYYYSDWVYESQVPAGAEIIDTKWTYLQIVRTTSSNPTLDGWELYDTQRTSWGPTQGPVYSNPSNGSRNVWTEQYVSGYNTKTVDVFYRYHPSDFYWYSARLPGTYDGWYCDTYEEFRADMYYIYPQSNWYRVEVSGGTVWCYYSGTIQVEDPNSPIMSTRWYYQEPVYTYYFLKEERKESSTDPSSWSDVAKVDKLVKYRILQ